MLDLFHPNKLNIDVNCNMCFNVFTERTHHEISTTHQHDIKSRYNYYMLYIERYLTQSIMLRWTRISRCQALTYVRATLFSTINAIRFVNEIIFRVDFQWSFGRFRRDL